MTPEDLISQQTEYRLLGKLLMWAGNADAVGDIDVSMFINTNVYNAVLAAIDMCDAGNRPTVLGIKNKLKWDASMDSIFENAASATAGTSDTALEVYTDLLERSQRRKLYYLGSRVQEMILSGENADFVASVIADETASATATDNNADKTLNEALQYSLERLKKPRRDEQREFVKTGIHAIDDVTGGFARGLLTIVAAPPSMGKTAFFVNCIANIANAGGKVYSANLEDLNLYVANRMIARFANIDSQRITINNDIDAYDIERAQQAVEKIRGENVILNDRPGQTASKIRRAVSRMRNRQGCDILFCDHLGELASSGDAYASTNANTKMLRDIAKEFDIAVVLASQLNRARDPRHEQQIPTIDRLRDSGRIAEFARAIWFLHRPARYSDTADPTQLIVNIAKSSHGRTGDIFLSVDLSRMEIK